MSPYPRWHTGWNLVSTMISGFRVLNFRQLLGFRLQRGARSDTPPGIGRREQRPMMRSMFRSVMKVPRIGRRGLASGTPFRVNREKEKENEKLFFDEKWGSCILRKA
eukprot:1382413-Amorphochlora_amoeboformis.AAC.1